MPQLTTSQRARGSSGDGSGMPASYHIGTIPKQGAWSQAGSCLPCCPAGGAASVPRERRAVPVIRLSLEMPIGAGFSGRRGGQRREVARDRAAQYWRMTSRRAISIIQTRAATVIPAAMLVSSPATTPIASAKPVFMARTLAAACGPFGVPFRLFRGLLISEYCRLQARGRSSARSGRKPAACEAP